jgi:hypothetical protein
MKMSKKLFIAAAAILGLLAIVGIAFAQGMWKRNAETGGNFNGRGMMQRTGIGQYHEQMYQIMENGNYADFVKFREETGSNMMPWVQNEEDFSLAKQMHEKMEKFHEGSGFKGKGRCPMMG